MYLLITSRLHEMVFIASCLHEIVFILYCKARYRIETHWLSLLMKNDCWLILDPAGCYSVVNASVFLLGMFLIGNNPSLVDCEQCVLNL